VCNAADFPPPIRQPPSPAVGGDPGPFYGAPIKDFPFPPQSYYYNPAGTTMSGTSWKMCSPGDPASILAFMHQSISTSAWTITGQTATDIAAQKPLSAATPGVTTPVYCGTLDVNVGGFPGYPGEWTFSVYPPATPCQ
jgi:hypothetical protein